MKRNKTAQELQNELRNTQINANQTALRNIRGWIEEGNLQKLQELADKYGISRERDATPPSRYNRDRTPLPTRIWQETRPAETLEELNSVLKANGYPPRKSSEDARDFMIARKIPMDFVDVHTAYKKYDSEEETIQTQSHPLQVRSKTPSRQSSTPSRRQSHEAGTGGGAERPSSAVRFEESAGQSGLRAMSPAIRREPEEEKDVSYDPPDNIEMDAERNQLQKSHALNNQPVDDDKAIESIYEAGANEPNTEKLVTEGGPLWQQRTVKHLNKAILKSAKRKPFIYEGSPIVNPSVLEKEARDRIKESSPFSAAEINKHNALNDILMRYAQDKTASNATRPYLDRMSQNPASQHHALMGDVERDFNRSILDQSTREFNEKILPGIRSHYQTPGLRQHGHMGKDIGEAVEKHGRGVSESLAKAGIGMRGMTLGAAGEYGKLQGHAAGISQKTAIQDRQNNIDAITAIENARKIRKGEENAHIQNLERIGAQNTDLAQRLRDFEIAQAHRIHEHPKTQATYATELIKGIPFPKVQTTVGAPPPRPQHTQGQTWSAAGQLLSGFAGHMMPQHHKEGGRIKKAIGGQVNPMQDVIQNAVIDRKDPVTELRDMLQHARGVQALEARQHLKIGGSVDPIKAGANDANMYAGHNAMKKKMDRMRNPSLTDSLGSAANIDPNTPGWFADSLRAFHRGYADRRRGVDTADDLEYKLQEKLEAKAEREREMARKDKMDAETISHIRAQNAHIGLQNEQIRHSMSQPKEVKQNYRNLEEIKNTRKHLQANRTARESVIDAGQVTELPTGALTGALVEKLPWGVGSHVVSAFTPGKTAEQFQTAKGATQSAFDALIAARTLANKHRLTDTQLKTIGEGKQSVERTPAQNKKNEQKILNDIKFEEINDIKNMIANNAPADEIEYEMAQSGLTWDDLSKVQPAEYLGTTSELGSRQPSRTSYTPEQVAKARMIAKERGLI